MLQRNFTLKETLKLQNYFLTNQGENIITQIIKEKKHITDFNYKIIQKLIISIFGIKGKKNNLYKDINELTDNNSCFNSLTSKIQTKLYLMKYLHLFEQNEKTNLSVIIFKNTPKKVLTGMFNIEDN